MRDFPSPAPVKTRKKRYSFKPGDDLVLVQTVLNDSDLFSLERGRRANAWEGITAALNLQGITSTAHSLRCRLKRLVNTFQAQGKQAEEFSPLDQLLAQYTQAEAQFFHGKVAAGPHGALRDQVQVEPSARSSINSRQNSVDTESDDESTTVTRINQAPPTSLDPPPISVQSTPDRGKNPRKRRFYFEDQHDVILLKAMLADRSGVRKPSWKNIEAAVKSQGIAVSAHTIRTHMRLLVDAHRREESMLDMEQHELMEKQKLLIVYCNRLDDKGQQNRGNNDDQAFEPIQEAQDEPSETRHEGHARRIHSSEPVGPPQSRTAATSTRPPQRTVSAAVAVNTPRTREAIATSTQTSEGISTLPVTHVSSTTQSRAVRTSTVSASGAFTSSVASGAVVAATPLNVKITEPASKRQKQDVETILERFLSEQNERQREERERERTRLSEQQDLQRQTINLQKRSLDIQEKAMNMQERLMALMEKVMDKLG